MKLKITLAKLVALKPTFEAFGGKFDIEENSASFNIFGITGCMDFDRKTEYVDIEFHNIPYPHTKPDIEAKFHLLLTQ